VSTICGLALSLALAVMQAGGRVGGDLRAGMQLVYSGDGREQPPWTIEAVDAGTALKERADCARVRIRRQPAPADAAEERLCVERDTLYGWNVARAEWIAQRPVGTKMRLTFTRANGDVVRYATGAASEETIGAHRVRVVPTVVTTSDASGRPTRRLTERYALTLTTATGGRFEVPDAAAPGGWRTEQVFELVAIRVP
jgi:hypothetical protein